MTEYYQVTSDEYRPSLTWTNIKKRIKEMSFSDKQRLLKLLNADIQHSIKNKKEATWKEKFDLMIKSDQGTIEPFMCRPSEVFPKRWLTAAIKKRDSDPTLKHDDKYTYEDRFFDFSKHETVEFSDIIELYDSWRDENDEVFIYSLCTPLGKDDYDVMKPIDKVKEEIYKYCVKNNTKGYINDW